VNGITRFASGFPISLSQNGDRSLTGGSGVDRPNYIGGMVITPDVRNTLNHTYFNKSAFTSEALGGPGTAAPRFFHGPGQENFDLGVDVNHAQFNNPSGSFTSGNFGRVTSAGPGRIAQVSAKFLW
jgi:hypothetical protein